MQLQLYPATLTSAQYAAGNTSLCGLAFAINPLVEQTINGDWSLTFEYPFQAAGAAQLTLGRLVDADGQLYRIDEAERSIKDGMRRLHVHALHLMYDLRDKWITNIETAELTPGGIAQRAALQQVLDGTAFTDGTIDTPELLDCLDILQKNAMWAIKEQVLPLWGGELQPDNWTINIRAQMGANRGVQLRHGKNLTGVRYSESMDGVVTRLHIAGYQGAGIEGINGGLDYIDSANIGAYPTIREDIVTFADDDLPEDLLSKGQAYLATVDTPRIKLSVDLAKIRGSEQYRHYRDLETVELGDTVTLYHKDLNINIMARVQSRSYDPVTGENVRVELGNDSRNLYSMMAETTQAAEAVKRILDRNGHLRGESIRGTIDLLAARLFASGSFVNATVNDETGVLFENTNESSVDYGAMFIGPGLFAIANSKDGNGQWEWRTFGTASGFYGSELVAESVTANKLASDVGQSLDLKSNVSITALVGDKVYRAASEAALLSYLAAQTPPVPMAVGLLWLNTTSNIMKRCSVVSPLTWASVQADEVRTSYIELANSLLKLLSGGKIQMVSGSSMELLAGSSLFIKAVGDAINALLMDSTGLTLSSTAKLKLLSAQAIEIGGKPFGVGGTNLQPGTSGVYANLAHSNIYYCYALGINLLSDLGLAVGDAITLKAYVKTDANVPAGGYRVTIRFDNSSGSSVGTAVSNLIPPSSEGWVEVTATIPANTDRIRYYFSTAGNVAITGTEQYKLFKLERGSIATDWSPALIDTANAIAAAVNGRTIIWYQPGIPTATGAGELWLDTDASPRKVYRAAIAGSNEIKAGEWEEITDELLAKALSAAGTAQATADGKIVTFAQADTPSATAVGDLWVDTDDNKKLYRATAPGTAGWVLYKIAAGYVSTSKITVDDDMVDILSGGKLRLTGLDGIYLGTRPFRVGGSNLLLNSRNMPQKANNTGLGTTVLRTDENEPYQRTTPDAGNSVSTYSSDGSINAACFVMPMVVGKVYTVSVEVRPQTSMDVGFYAGQGRQAAVAGVWTRINYTYSYTNHVRVVGLKGYTNSTYIDSKNWKIEAAPAATDWCEADGELHNTGLTIDSVGVEVKSGANIKLLAAESILIGGSPFRVGGTNLIDGTSAAYKNEVFSAQYYHELGRITLPNSQVSIGDTITVRMYIKLDANPLAGMKLYIQEYNGSTYPGIFGNIIAPSSEGWTEARWTIGAGAQYVRFLLYAQNAPTTFSGTEQYKLLKVEKGYVATDWSLSPNDPAVGVKTAFIDMAADHIYMYSGGAFVLTSPNLLAITGGSTDATAIAIRNDTDYFISAGHLTQASAPFYLKKDGFIKAISGLIGGFLLGATKLYNGKTSLDSTEAGIYIGTDGVSMGPAGVAPPIRLKPDGTIRATKIQQEYSQSFLDLADASYPAEFPVYIPSGYTIDTVTFSFLTKKYRAFSKGMSSGSGNTGGSGALNTGLTANPASGLGGPAYSGYESSHTHVVSVQYTPSTPTSQGGSSHRHTVGEHSHVGDGGNHQHSLADHTHAIGPHTHPLSYGIYEKAALATSCVLKVGATTIGTYSPNPASPVEIKTYLAAGWNTITVQPNDDARIAGYLLVKLTPT